MLWPLVVLAIGAVFAGYVGVQIAGGGMLGLFHPHGAVHHFLEPAIEPFAYHVAHGAPLGHCAEFGLMYISGTIAILGIFIAYSIYVKNPLVALVLRDAFPRVHRVLANKYYVDELYQRGIVEPLRQMGRFCFAIDEYFIDGIIWLVTAIPRLMALILSTLQRGAVQGYGASMAAGLALILVWVLMNGS